MEQGFSGLIAYPILIVIQIIMLSAMLKISADIWRGRGCFAAARPSWSGPLIGFSGLYAASMVARYALTMLFKPEMRWFSGTIPIFFHFVLAGFIYTWGRFHSR